MSEALDRVINFGCRLNIAEGEAVRANLAATRQPGQPQRIVINSCAVTAEAVRQSAAAARRADRENPAAQVIVTGCAAQIEPDRFLSMKSVDRVLGNYAKLDHRSYNITAPQHIIAPLTALAKTAPQLIDGFDGHARAFLEVQNGCDHSCTFCTIPQGRGPARSISIDHVIEAAERLLENGHREIVLTGVDVTSWGQDIEGTPRLGDLCAALLNALPNLRRLRLGSLDVAEIDPLLFHLLTSEPRMMPHVHLSLQAGDDLILKRMKRRHSRADAVALVARLKNARPDIAIGADLIAGFPTECEAAAANSLALIDDCDIVFAHIFPYSPRSGTPAALMPQVPLAVGKARAATLRAASATRRERWMDSLIGSSQRLLLERDGQTGHLPNFARARLFVDHEIDSSMAGQDIEVRIIARDALSLVAKQVV